MVLELQVVNCLNCDSEYNPDDEENMEYCEDCCEILCPHCTKYSDPSGSVTLCKGCSKEYSIRYGEEY